MPRLPAPPSIKTHPVYAGLTTDEKITFFDTVSGLPHSPEVADFLAWLQSDSTNGGERWKKVRRWLRNPKKERKNKVKRAEKVRELEEALKSLGGMSAGKGRKSKVPPLPFYDSGSDIESPPGLESPGLSTSSSGSSEPDLELLDCSDYNSESSAPANTPISYHPLGSFITACGRSFSPTPEEILAATRTDSPTFVPVEEQTANFHIMQRSPSLRSQQVPTRRPTPATPKLIIPRTNTIRSMPGGYVRQTYSPATKEANQFTSAFHLSPRGDNNPLAQHIRGLRTPPGPPSSQPFSPQFQACGFPH